MRLFDLHPFFRPSVSLKNRRKLPTKPGVYYALQWWKPFNRPLYVGESGNINARWNSRNYGDHHQLYNLSHRFGVRLHYRVTATKSAAQRLEATEIRRYRPTFNRRVEPLRKDLLRDVIDFCVDSIGIAALLLVIVFAIGAVIR
ncbi:MAG: hypothetical protein LH660_17090 [Phormidesmis sp. CAN_BIN36]|nr:hypothetical protein [Phormidesmis sp. CAN_BIN36]